MIKINLLPVELSKKEKKISMPVGFKADYLVWAKKFLIGIVSIHVALLVIFIIEKSYLAGLSQKLNRIKPDLVKVNKARGELKNLEAKAKFSSDLRAGRTLWSRNLNKISEFAPKGMWLRRLSVSDTNFILEGSVACAKCSPVDIISVFLNSLKKENKFMEGFGDLELVSVQKKVQGGMDVADFLISGKLKESQL